MEVGRRETYWGVSEKSGYPYWGRYEQWKHIWNCQRINKIFFKQKKAVMTRSSKMPGTAEQPSGQ